MILQLYYCYRISFPETLGTIPPFSRLLAVVDTVTHRWRPDRQIGILEQRFAILGKKTE